MTKLSRTQHRALTRIQAGGNPWDHAYGMSARGGLMGTMKSLIRRGLIVVLDGGDQPYQLTAAGIQELSRAESE